MSALFHQLGVDWKLLISQAVNFGILFIALTALVYRPLLKIIKERRDRIEFGLRGAEAAEKKLAEIDEIKIAKIVEADREALNIVSSAEELAARRRDELVSDAETEAEKLLEEGARIVEQKKEEELLCLEKEAHTLVREIVAKTVELDPRAIDEKLIKNAIGALKSKKVL